ncbi:MAG: hypothetical protein AAGI07_16940 [Bacteroidota bacterium]
MKEEDTPNQIPAWLKETQNKSWEPEIIISGLILASLFILPEKLFVFCTMLIQEYAVEFTSVFLIMLYLSLVVNVFKVFFITHLLSRLIWTGLVGLSYAFPRGVDSKKSFKKFSHYNFSSPTELVIKLEKWCSMLFAFPVYIGIIFIVFTLLLFLIVTLSTILDLGFIATFSLFFIIWLFYMIIILVYNRSPVAERIGTSIPSTISSVYQSNLGKWKVQLFIIIITLIAIPFIYNDQKDIILFGNLAKIDSELAWPNKANWYEEYHDKSKRYPRAFIKTASVKDDFLMFNVVFFAEDSKNVSIVSNHLELIDSLDWHTIEKPTDLMRVYLNDSLIYNPEWYQAVLPITQQKILQAFLNIELLPKGRHVIRIEKLCYFDLGFSNPEVRYREKWAEIPFVKLH